VYGGEVRVDDVAFELICEPLGITNGEISDTFSGDSLDTDKWAEIQGTAGSIPPDVTGGWMVYDDDDMYNIMSYASFNDLLDYSGTNRYKLKLHIETEDGGTPESAVMACWGIMNGVGNLTTSGTGMFWYHYFSYSSPQTDAYISTYNYQGGSPPTYTGSFDLDHLDYPVTDVYYTFIFDDTNVSIYADDADYSEAGGDLVATYAHGITDLDANGSVYLKIDGRSGNRKTDEISLETP